MKRIPFVACLAVAIVACGPLCVPALLRQTPRDPKLRAELLKREKADQEARNAWIAWMQKYQASPVKPQSKTPPKEITRVWKVDAENRAWLKKVIAKVGWPGRSLVGNDGAAVAWMIVQHADRDVPFQKRCLPLIQAAAARGEVDKKDVAMLTDRVLVAEGKKQIYGTQCKIENGDAIPHPIEDEANVDKRRAEVGMPPMAEYLKVLKEMYFGKKPDKQDKP